MGALSLATMGNQQEHDIGASIKCNNLVLKGYVSNMSGFVDVDFMNNVVASNPSLSGKSFQHSLHVGNASSCVEFKLGSKTIPRRFTTTLRDKNHEFALLDGQESVILYFQYDDVQD